MKEHKIEIGPGFSKGLRDLPGHLTLKSVSAGTVAAIFGCSGPALIVIDGARKGGLTDGQTVAWLIAIYVIGGLISVGLALYYKQPINGAYSIPGAALIAGSLAVFPFDQVVGAFVMSGVIVLALGVSGLIGRVMRWLPTPIVMAMIAGALIRFAIGAVSALQSAPIIAGASIISFFVAARLTTRIPPVLAALIAGLAVAFLTSSINIPQSPIDYILPELTAPTFSLDALIAISIPLALLVIGAENAQASGVLLAEDYRPPVNVMTIVSGIGGIIAGLFGGHNANIAGPMTAICSSEQAGEEKQGRYAATVVNGVWFAAFGLVAGIAVPLIMALPRGLIGTVAGLAMISVLLTAFQTAFSKSAGHQTAALVTLAVAMSNVNIIGISAPFWSLLAGVAVSMLLGEKQRLNTTGNMEKPAN